MNRLAWIIVIVALLLIVGAGALYVSGRVPSFQAEQPMEVCIEAQEGAVGTSCD